MSKVPLYFFLHENHFDLWFSAFRGRGGQDHGPSILNPKPSTRPTSACSASILFPPPSVSIQSVPPPSPPPDAEPIATSPPPSPLCAAAAASSVPPPPGERQMSAWGVATCHLRLCDSRLWWKRCCIITEGAEGVLTCQISRRGRARGFGSGDLVPGREGEVGWCVSFSPAISATSHIAGAVDACCRGAASQRETNVPERAGNMMCVWSGARSWTGRGTKVPQTSHIAVTKPGHAAGDSSSWVAQCRAPYRGKNVQSVASSRGGQGRAAARPVTCGRPQSPSQFLKSTGKIW